jgi:hypothetical protein
MKCRVLTMGLLTTVLVAGAFAASEQITWVNWVGAEGRLEEVDSSVPGVTAQTLLAASGKRLSSAADLKAAGWLCTEGGFLQNDPLRGGGEKIVVAVSALPRGVQNVYLRFFSQPREKGEEWYYATITKLEQGQGQPKTCEFTSDAAEARLIRGKGGFDQNTIYEIKIGSVGTEQEPVEQVRFSIERYVWTKLSKVGSIRIETEPALDYAPSALSSAEQAGYQDTLLQNGPKTPEGKPIYGVKVASGMLKIRPNSFDSLAGQPLADSIAMSAARGEYESRQVVVYAVDQDLQQTRLECSDLRSAQGDVIAAAHLLFAPVGFVKYRVNHDLQENGYWPDPILDFLTSFTIRKRDVQALWYRVHVPTDAKPGTYSGTVTIRPENAPPQQVKVDVRVWNFQLPTMPYYRVVVAHNQSNDFEMDYGINPTHIYSNSEDWADASKQWAARGVTALHAVYGCIGVLDLDQTTRMPTAEQLQKWLDDIGKRLEALDAAGLRDKAYVYMFDESTAEWHPAMRQISDAIAARFPGLLILTTAHDPSYGEATDLPKIGGWVPLLNHYNYETAKEARKKGKQVWWYTCNSPKRPLPNVWVTNSGIENRLLMGFMAFAFASDGFLYYAIDGGSLNPQPAITAGPYTQWTILDGGHSHWYQRGPQGALPSLRLENIRDGLEDYDYLFMARKLMAELKDKGLADETLRPLEVELEPLFSPGNTLVNSLTVYSQSSDLVEKLRADLGRYLEAATARLAAAGK